MAEEVLGNDVNMMPGFMVIGMSCFGMPYGAQTATWIEVAKTYAKWDEVRPTRATVKYTEHSNAT